MKRTDLAIEEYRHIAARAPLVWALACDTNRWDRVIGAPPSRYEYGFAETDRGRVRQRLGAARFFWGEASWIERGEWLEGRMIKGERRFTGGIISTAGFEVQLEPVGDEVDVRASYYLEAHVPIDETLAATVKRKSQRRLTRYLDGLVSVLESCSTLDPEYDGEPAADWGRRVAATASDGELFLGPRSPTAEAELSFRAQRAAPDLDPEVLDKMVHYLRERTDDELQQIRPFELARLWHKDRRRTLGSFLHAARAGLFDLRWQTICPTCKVGAAQHDHLASVGTRSYCAACDEHFSVDFAGNIEAVFRANPAVRKSEAQLWCASSPWFRPHIFAVQELAPGEVRELPAVPGEPLLVRTEHGPRVAPVDATRGAEIEIGTTSLAVTAGEPGGAIVLRNASDSVEMVFIERANYQPDAARGADLMALPEFHDLFAMDAPATGVDLAVGSVTVMFCDLTASTALYRDVGDGRAFAIINDHFTVFSDLSDRHRGAVVKTMGDAIMAAFLSPAEAVAAAIDMVRAAAALHPHHAMHLKVGLHEGPALAVRANHRLDFFGTTVNLAARLQEAAEADQIVIAESLLEHPEVARLTRDTGTITREEISPKGLPALPCVKLTVAL